MVLSEKFVMSVPSARAICCVSSVCVACAICLWSVHSVCAMNCEILCQQFVLFICPMYNAQAVSVLFAS
jgi:hypothetical protein